MVPPDGQWFVSSESLLTAAREGPPESMGSSIGLGAMASCGRLDPRRSTPTSTNPPPTWLDRLQMAPRLDLHCAPGSCLYVSTHDCEARLAPRRRTGPSSVTSSASWPTYLSKDRRHLGSVQTSPLSLTFLPVPVTRARREVFPIHVKRSGILPPIRSVTDEKARLYDSPETVALRKAIRHAMHRVVWGSDGALEVCL